MENIIRGNKALLKRMLFAALTVSFYFQPHQSFGATHPRLAAKSFENVQPSTGSRNEPAPPLSIQDQPINVTGTTKDSQDRTLPGVNIIIKGTNRGVTSDIDGRFTLRTQLGQVLVFSFLGYQQQEFTIQDSNPLSVIMLEDARSIDEVVVVGYGTQKKVNLSGAVGQISGKVLEDRPLTNIGEGLQGTIPNLQITQNGFAPGRGTSFNVRGFTSINGGSPLILVDGAVQDPNLVNPDDVESVTVLKDAASAAIYGARAAYGVILITTKKGKKEQRPTASVNLGYSHSSVIRLSSYADSKQYIEYMNLASRNAGGSDYFDQRLVEHALKYYNDPHNNLPVYYDPAIDTEGKYNYSGNTDWAKELYKDGLLKQINANISGGSEKSQYYFSYGYLDQEGFLSSYNDKYQKHMFNIKVDTDINKWLVLSANMRYTYTFEDHPSGGSNGYSGLSEYSGQLKNDLNPLMPIRHPDGNWSGQGNVTNPFAVGAEGGYDRRKVNDLWIVGGLKIKPTEWINLNIDYTFNPYSWNKERTSRLFNEYWAEPGLFNIYPWVNPNSVALENTNDYYNALNAYSDFSQSFSNHNFKLLIGYNHEIKTNKWIYAKREDLIDNDLPAINRATGKEYTNGSESSWAVQGIFARFNYDYKGKYLLEFNGRYDGSSKFPKSDRFGFFPSASLGWRVSEEPFWTSIRDTWNEMKIRLSYGKLGNQYVTGNFPYIANYSINTSMNYLLGGDKPVGVGSGNIVSPSFTWETVKQFNAGIDLQFLSNRLTASSDYYQRQTEGMFVPGKPVPGILGVGVPSENAANLKTYGWEFSVSWRDKIGQLGYQATVVLSDSQSEITKYDNPTGILSNYYIGRKIGEIWGFNATGLFQSEEEITSHANQNELYGGSWNPGDVRYVDSDGDGKISRGKNTLSEHGDLSIIGNSTQRLQYGITLAADWKGLDLNIFLQGVGKRDLWTGNNQFFGIGNQWDVPRKESLDYWTEEHRDARLPRPYIDGGHGNRNVSTLYLQNGAYLRLKQLSLGYTLPEHLSKKIQMTRVRFYATGQNLLTYTKLSKLYDPENIDVNGYPTPRTFSLGLNLTF